MNNKSVYLGKNAVVSSCEILGIFNFETSTIMKSTRSFLESAEKKGETENVSNDIPKYFSVCLSENGERKIYFCDKIKTVTEST